jgi:hypothetical protein
LGGRGIRLSSSKLSRRWRGGVVKVSAGNVDEGVWYEFKNYVLRKYGKLRGVLGREVSEALKLYLEEKSGKVRGVQG